MSIYMDNTISWLVLTIQFMVVDFIMTYVQKFSQYLIFMNFAVNAATMKIKSVMARQTNANIHPIEALQHM